MSAELFCEQEAEKLGTKKVQINNLLYYNYSPSL